MNVAVVAGLALAVLLVRDRWPVVPLGAVPVAGAFGVEPSLALIGVGGWGCVVLLRRRRRHMALAAQADGDVSLTAHVLLIALSAGLSLSAGLRAASERTGPLIQAELASIFRQGARFGMAQALRDHQGRLGRLALLLARAHVTGASVTAAVQTFVSERRDEERVASLEAARRLPVKLTIPLALLILPGFVVLTVGPSVLDSARRLLGPVLPIP